MAINLKKSSEAILAAALKAVDPHQLIKEQVRREGSVLHFPGKQTVDLDHFDRVFVYGAGKGVAPMAKAMEELLGDELAGGDVIVKYHHTDQLKTIRLHEAAHPVPDQNTIDSTNILLKNMQGLTDKDCVFVLLTGGGSALMESLKPDISLENLQALSELLLDCGANIHEINCIRKHISEIKGGQLAKRIYPARCITLALSDVIGDDLSVIASGPTNADRSTYQEALHIVEKYGIKGKIPGPILKHLQKGVDGEMEETPKPGDKIFTKVSNLVIGNNRLALVKAAERAKMDNFNVIILTSMLSGEAREIGLMLSAIIREVQISNQPLLKPACILLGGEPTVHIRGSGKGGRNQELALAVAISGIEDSYLFVSCGSDGTDGPTDAAGAVVDQNTLKRAATAGLDAQSFLNENDSYHFFKALGDLIITGPTGTNVMDIVFALIPE